jgi:hypothetical protein
MWNFFRDIVGGALAVLVALLPRRVWPRFPALPVRKAAAPSAILTIVLAAIVGLGGFLAFSERISRETATLILKAGEAQLQGKVPNDPAVSVAPIGIAALTPFAFLFTPIGMLAAYMALSGLVRAATCVVDDAIGDPILSGIDALVQRVSGNARQARRRRERERAEGAEAPDRLYPADWARLPDADFVVVASRRKPDWDKGTFVITSDKWYVIGEPFDMQLPDGLRTIYPLKEHTTRDVMRRGVNYELPPLRTRKGIQQGDSGSKGD